MSESMYDQSFSKLCKAIGSVELSPDEIKTLLWLSKCDPETVDNICSVIEKVKGGNLTN